MVFIALIKFKINLSKEVIAENLKDIKADEDGQVRYLGIYWTLGSYVIPSHYLKRLTKK